MSADELAKELRRIETTRSAETSKTEQQPTLSDAGNAETFAREHGADLRWVPEWGTWLRYDGARWVRTPTEQLIPLAIRTARGFYARAADYYVDPEMSKKLAAHAKVSESAGRLEAMVRLARGQLVARADAFDADPLMLNCANGT